MECPICFNAYKLRALKGCAHEICNACYKQLASLDESVYYTLRAYYVADLYQICVKCPMCRTVEPNMSVDELKTAYPDEYLKWMEFELHRSDDGSTYAFDYSPWNYEPRSTKPPKYVKPRKTKRISGRKM